MSDYNPPRFRQLARVFGRRILAVNDPGEGQLNARFMFGSHLGAEIRRASGKREYRDLGSGLVTNVGLMAMANDWNWAAPSGAAINTLKLANYHATGTGTTAAATTDIALQTLASPTTTTAVTGTQSNTSTANTANYKTSATVNYTSTLAITEWGLHTAATLSASTGSPFTAGSANTGTVTSAPLAGPSSTTVQGQQQTVFKDTTNGTPFWGLVLSNSTSVVTVNAWYKVSDGTTSGSNPANADAYVILPVMLDHRVFSALNVLSGDSVTYNYTLTLVSGT